MEAHTPNFDSLLAGASQLPPDARIEFIDALWTTLPEEALPPLSAEWRQEIERRSVEYDRGVVQSLPWEQVRAAAVERLGPRVNETE